MPDGFFVTGIALSQFYFGGERLGLPSAEVLRSIGLDPTIALQPMSQVSVEHYEQFILEMVLHSGDEMFGSSRALTGWAFPYARWIAGLRTKA